MSALAIVVPADVDAPTGGNVWDRRVRDALDRAGHGVAWHEVAGSWPTPSRAAVSALEQVLAATVDGESVLLDGLVACGAPDVVVDHAERLHVGVVLHLPLRLETGLDPVTAQARDTDERRVLAAVDVVLTTSRWTADWLAGHELRRPPVVARPGTDPAPLHPRGTTTGRHLLCLGTVSPRKGQRTLLHALAQLDGSGVLDCAPGWSLRLVGLQPDPAELATLRRERDAAGLAGRVELVGPLVGDALEEQWRWADLLVVPSRVETFGMVVTEALARGRPVLVTTGSALPESLGGVLAGPPGLLVDHGPDGLREALRDWLTDAGLRDELVRRAHERAGGLLRWEHTGAAVLAAFR